MRGWPQYGGEGGALLWEKPTMVVVTVQPPRDALIQDGYMMFSVGGPGWH